MILSVVAGLFIFGGCQPKPLSDWEIENRIEALLSQMSLEEKIEMIGGNDGLETKPIKSLGIPSLRMGDGPCGLRIGGLSTAYPAPISYAASWDTLVASHVGEAIALEARAKQVQIMLGPAMNIYRAPMCGRNFEYFGEDPYLAGQIASAYIRGMQGEGVMATAKHFAANNQEFDRNGTSSDVDERTLHEIYLPAFKACVDEGHLACVMTSYNPLNGIHTSQHDYLINQVLKHDWDFKGIVVSDWGSVYNGVAAANAGLDLEMPNGTYMCRDTLWEAIKNGKLKGSVMDDKICRILRMAYKFNFMDTAHLHKNYTIDRNRLANVALEAARGGIVMLKNANNTLPIDLKKIKSIAVLGPNAGEAVTGGGGSSMVFPYTQTSVYEGIKKAAGSGVEVRLESGPFVQMPSSAYANTRFEGNSLKGEYYNNMDLQGPLIATRNDACINFYWDEGNRPKGIPVQHFSVRWTGKYRSPATGRFRIGISGDDGYRLYLDGKLLIDKWVTQSETLCTEEVDLEGGKVYDIRLEYFQNGAGANIRFGVTPVVSNQMEKALTAAKNSDVAVVCVGFNPSTEGESFDRPYGLPKEQEAFIKKVASINKNTMVVLNAGGNAAIANWIGDVSALLHVWYAGEMGAQAIAEILFGKTNPSGKLPISIEKKWEDAATFNSYYDADHDKHVTYTEGIFLGYRHFDTHRIEPLFPFGFGLSFTTFEYSNLKVTPEKFTVGQDVLVSVDVKNTGKVEGKEVVELYVSDPQSSLPRPEKELKAFSKVSLAPGETKIVTMKLNKGAFSYYDPLKHGWVAEPGAFDILVGTSSKAIKQRKRVRLK